MGNPFIIYTDDDAKSPASDYCRYNHQHIVPEHVMVRLQRNPFRRMDDISLARSNSGPWQPGSLLQRVVEREAAVDADHTDVDSMPDLVTVQADWDSFMSEGETDDDDGHIVDEYGLEEETSLLQGSFNNHLSETRRARRRGLQGLVEPHLLESNVLSDWASQRRPRTLPERSTQDRIERSTQDRMERSAEGRAEQPTRSIFERVAQDRTEQPTRDRAERPTQLRVDQITRDVVERLARDRAERSTPHAERLDQYRRLQSTQAFTVPSTQDRTEQTTHHRVERPGNPVLEASRRARQELAEGADHNEVMARLRQELHRERSSNGDRAQRDSSDEVSRIAQQVIEQMDSRVAEIRARADRRVQEASRAFRAQQQRAEAESAVIRRQAEEHSTTMQGIRARVASRREVAARAAMARRAQRGHSRAAELAQPAAVAVDMIQSGAAEMRM